MEELIKEMEAYALQYDIPIMQKEGIEFFRELIVKQQIKSILELGTAIGYSAIQLARIAPEIHVISIERDEERYLLAIENVKKANLEQQITLVLGDALETEISEKVDCLFIDAAKAQYIKFFERYEPNLNERGVVVSDNLKFHGLVDDMSSIKTRNLRSLVRKIKQYNEFLLTNEQFDTKFYDMGDGIAVSYRRND